MANPSLTFFPPSRKVEVPPPGFNLRRALDKTFCKIPKFHHTFLKPQFSMGVTKPQPKMQKWLGNDLPETDKNCTNIGKYFPLMTLFQEK